MGDIRACLGRLEGVLAGAASAAVDVASEAVRAGAVGQGSGPRRWGEGGGGLVVRAPTDLVMDPGKEVGGGSFIRCLQHNPPRAARKATQESGVAGCGGAQAAVFTRPGEDRLLVPAEAAAAGKLRLDVGWTLHKKAEEAEDTSVEFSILCYNLAVS